MSADGIHELNVHRFHLFVIAGFVVGNGVSGSVVSIVAGQFDGSFGWCAFLYSVSGRATARATASAILPETAGFAVPSTHDQPCTYHSSRNSFYYDCN